MKLIRSSLLTVIITVQISEGLNVSFPHCVFPFNYLQRLYYSCIPNSRMDRAYWCSKTSDYDRDSQWEFCTTLGDQPRPIIAQCNFPFIFLNNQFNSCTKVGRSDNQLWCSTTPNYDEDGHWIFCSTPGVRDGLWWSSRRGVSDNERSPDDMNSPDSIYENIEGKESKDTPPI
ncbi:seminal plasma protein HSP-1-like isoform X2 [Eleutherodactylus coqui]|uniref:seminal plasma protein HSP-1-like isoform X2 n=1 Tax=Eleutherodactylus coqui TaxID=57060 RepID=UPI0034632AAF